MISSISTGGYLLSEQEIADILRGQMVQWNLIEPRCPYSVRLLDLGADQQLAQSIEAKVFRRTSGDRARELIEAWYLYEAGNFAIVLVSNPDSANGVVPKVVGTMRIGCGTLARDLRTVVHLTEPEPWGFDSIRTLEDNMVGYSWNEVWDISTLVVDPETKRSGSGRKAVLALFHALFQLMEARGTKLLIGIVAEKVYRELDTLGLGLVPLGDTAMYYASKARLFAIHVPALWQNLGRNERYRSILLQGAALSEFDIQVGDTSQQ